MFAKRFDRFAVASLPINAYFRARDMLVEHENAGSADKFYLRLVEVLDSEPLWVVLVY